MSRLHYIESTPSNLQTGRRLVICHDGRTHERRFEVTSNADATEPNTEEENAEGDHVSYEHHIQVTEGSGQLDIQHMISFIDFIRPFPKVQGLWITFHPYLDEESPGFQGLHAAANECDRKRQDPDQAVTLRFPKVKFLALAVLAPVTVRDWAEYLDPIKLSQLKSTLKQLDLPNLRVWHLDLDEMFSFHLGENANGEVEGETSWELLRDALQSAMFPKLREFYFNLEFEILAFFFGTNLCVSTVPIPTSLPANHRDLFRTNSNSFYAPFDRTTAAES